MGSHRTPAAAWTAGRRVAALCLFLALAAVVARAQQNPLPGPPPPGNRDPVAEARERQRREAQLRSLEMVGGAKKPDDRGAEAAAGQLKEDFKSIQVHRNKMVRHLLSEKPLDYKFIVEEVAEINRRAGRLKYYLIRNAAEGDKREPVEIGEGQMKDALVTLCKRIDSFTENPIFKDPTVVDIAQSAKADRDLRHILLLTDGIKRTAERLHAAHKR